MVVGRLLPFLEGLFSGAIYNISFREGSFPPKKGKMDSWQRFLVKGLNRKIEDDYDFLQLLAC